MVAECRGVALVLVGVAKALVWVGEVCLWLKGAG